MELFLGRRLGTLADSDSCAPSHRDVALAEERLGTGTCTLCGDHDSPSSIITEGERLRYNDL